MDEWEKCLVRPETPIRQGLESMSKSRQQIILVVDEERRLLGSVTEGDFRRGVLAGVTLDRPVTAIMKTAPVVTTPGSDMTSRIALMRQHSVRHLPVVDEHRRVVGLVRPESLIEAETPRRDNWVVIMAGGEGQRLRPLTDAMPKPLLMIGGKPILETIIARLVTHGLRHVYLAINYRGEQVKAHFRDGARFGVEIRYIEESQSMGTAGALSLIRDVHTDPLLIVNGDVLTKINFGALLAYHDEYRADASICVREFETQVPFGIVTFSQGRVTNIIEKPVQRFMVNAGIYVINPDVLSRVRKDGPSDMTDVLRQLALDGGNIVGFPMQEYWIDIGRPEDLSKASADFDSHFS